MLRKRESPEVDTSAVHAAKKGRCLRANDHRRLIGELHNRYVFGRRVRVLARHLRELLPEKASVLDVGCGDGSIGRLVLGARADLSIVGIDVALRPNLHIDAKAFDGKNIPYPDKSFDAVVFVDVLHHTTEPTALIGEAMRVSRNCIIIKDHNLNGVGAEPILRVMDWIGNAPHGVVLTYNYWPEERWRKAFAESGLRIGEYRADLGLYPWPASWIFERSLHFVARLEIDR